MNLPVPRPSEHSCARRSHLGVILASKFGLDSSQVDHAISEQQKNGGRLGEIMVSLGIINQDTLAEALSFQFGIPFLAHIAWERVHVPLVERLPITFGKFHNILPLWEEEGAVCIAMADPLAYAALDDLQVIFQKPVRPVLVPTKALLMAINQIYEHTANHHAADAIEDLQDEESLDSLAHQIEAPHDLLDMADDAPIIRLVNSILFQGVKQRASDIHVESFERELIVRYRIDGILYQVLTLPARLNPIILSRIKILGALNIAEKRLPQDGRFSVTIAGRSVDIRVSVIPTAHGERAVLRILEKHEALLDLEEIGLSPDLFEEVTRLLHLSHGMVLVTGPTGSGKTTTLYASLSRMNSTERNILTIEDPVEYQLAGVGQIQVNPKINLTFANGLRSILRQDPDVVMVGEIRDRETAEIAIHASLTGHLVFSTLHTNDSAGAITRLIDMGIEPFLITSSMVAVMAQRLLRKICPSCRYAYPPNALELKKLGMDGSNGSTVGPFYRGAGCSSCLQTGYHGRTGIYEILIMNDHIRAMTVNREDSSRIRQEAVKQGMRTLWEEGLHRVVTGETSAEEIIRVLQVKDVTSDS
jgi:general secretion pathway protein E